MVPFDILQSFSLILTQFFFILAVHYEVAKQSFAPAPTL